MCFTRLFVEKMKLSVPISVSVYDLSITLWKSFLEPSYYQFINYMLLILVA